MQRTCRFNLIAIEVLLRTVTQDECEMDPDLLSMQSSVSGSNRRNSPIVCSYMANISACAGAALNAVMPHPRYNPAHPSRLYTSVNTCMKDLEAYWGLARSWLPTVSAG